MKAVRDRVIIKPDEKEERTQGGIILTDSQKELPAWGVIISVGTDKDGNQLDVNVGDYVMFHKYSAIHFEHKGESCLVIRFSELFVTNNDENIELSEWYKSSVTENSSGTIEYVISA